MEGGGKCVIKAVDLIAKFKYALDNKWGYVYGASGQLWTQAKQDAATREQTVKYGQKWVGHYVADCSGLFTWAFKQLGGYMYHGSNTMYKSYCTEKGKLTDEVRKTLLPGTAVFTGTENDHGHVGLYIGNNTVIEAKGTAYGVVTSKLTDSKWTYWGKLKGVEYGENAHSTPSEPADDKTDTQTLPTLRRGDKGDAVRYLQTLLLERGYDLGKWGADGDFGNATEKAVKQFQRDWGLVQDGVVGKKTWAMLTSTPEKPKTYTVRIEHLPEATADEIISKYGGEKKAEG